MPLNQHQSLKRLLLHVLLLGSGALLAMGGLAPSVHGAPGDLVQVCHRDPDNPSKFKIITVSSSAVAVHLAHGDNVVQPEVCDGVDNDCDGIVDNHLCGDFGTCTVGTGICEKMGTNQCVGGNIVCSVTPTACEACQV